MKEIKKGCFQAGKVLLCCFFVNLLSGGQAVSAEEVKTFYGSWSASGTKEILVMGSEREAAVIKLSGHVNLQNRIGASSDYWSTCIGLSDSITGADLRCVWKGMEGNELYVSLHAQQMSKGILVHGDIVGGSGDAQGITGSLQFHWETLITAKDNRSIAIGGYAKDLKGSYTLP